MERNGKIWLGRGISQQSACLPSTEDMCSIHKKHIKNKETKKSVGICNLSTPQGEARKKAPWCSLGRLASSRSLTKWVQGIVRWLEKGLDAKSKDLRLISGAT